MKSLKPKIKTIILASGRSRRLKREIPKQFLEITGIPLIIHTLRKFQNSREIDEIVVVTLSNHVDETRDLIKNHKITKAHKIVSGGNSRQESSRIGVDECGDDTDFVLIHDAVRPFISINLLKNIIKALKKHKAVVPVITTNDTILEIDNRGFIKDIPTRSMLRRVQTPQAFKYDLIRKAHEQALRNGLRNSTDDSFLLLKLGIPVFTLEGEEENIKITFPIDFDIAGKLLQN